MIKSAYIHIPFCRQKCNYCSFVSFPRIELKNHYLEVLIREIEHFYRHDLLNTLYFGGGTPSLLTASDFDRIISLFNIDKNAEVTTELNPENITAEYLRELKVGGVNRLSFGCQTFDDGILKIIGRRHTAQDVVNAVEAAKKAGFDNVSLDFIYGLPEQSLQDFEYDLKRAVSLDIQHISLYGLKIDENCYFSTHMPKKLPDDDMQAQMYESAINILTENGFEHYEISNFAKPSRYSRHNMNYWNNASYYGFGLAAHGYIDGVRYENATEFENYFVNPLKHLNSHKVTDEERLEEEIFLGFRRMKGINIKDVNRKFNIDFEKLYKNVLDKYEISGHLEKFNGCYRLTTAGILVSNLILAEFLSE